MNDELYETLYNAADVVMELEEVNGDEIYRNLVFEAAKSQTDSFFEIIKEKLNNESEIEQQIFLKECMFNAFIFSIRRMIVELDYDDELIDEIAENLCEKIKQVTRREWYKNNPTN